MATKTTEVRARIEPAVKQKASRILEKVGLTPSDAIHNFFHMIIEHQGLPYDVKIPNKLTRETLEKTDRGEDLHYYASKEELFEDLRKL